MVNGIAGCATGGSARHRSAYTPAPQRQIVTPRRTAVFALAAVVTQEGRVANYELLVSERDGARLREAAANLDEVSAMLDAVSQSRFEPAQGASGAPVAVNMVWLLARTTVEGSPHALELEMLQWRRSRLAPSGPGI